MESAREPGNRVVVGPALEPGEDGEVDLVLDVVGDLLALLVDGADACCCRGGGGGGGDGVFFVVGRRREWASWSFSVSFHLSLFPSSLPQKKIKKAKNSSPSLLSPLR